MDLMTTFSLGKLSWSFTIRYLVVDANTSYFALIGRKTLNELEAIVSTPHLKMKIPTLIGEIVTIKVGQKQAQQCYAVSLKVASYPPIRESSKPHSPFGGSNSQVMSIVEEFPIRTLTLYKTTRGNPDDTFDVDPGDDTIDKGLKPIEDIFMLQLGPKPG